MSDDKDKCNNDNKKNYLFFNDPEIIAKRAELSALKANQQRHLQQQQQVQQKECTNYYSLNQRLQPYPFTFISALRRKLELEAQNDVQTNGKSDKNPAVDKVDTMDSNFGGKLGKMTEYNSVSRETNIQRNISPNKLLSDPIVMDTNKEPKSSERINRKLEFLSSQGSLISNSDDIKQLKTPDVQFVPSFPRKKAEQRDSSRESKNAQKSKRLKKDESERMTRDDCEGYDPNLKKRNPKHNPKRDLMEPSSKSSAKSLLSDRSSRLQKDKKVSGSVSNKTEDKKGIGLTGTKGDDRKSPLGPSKMAREMKNKVGTSSESASDRNGKLYDYITIRNDSRSHSNDYGNQGMMGNGVAKQLEDQKYRGSVENVKGKYGQGSAKDSHKRVCSEKPKSSKNHHRTGSGAFNTEIPMLRMPEDLELGPKYDSIYTDLSVTGSKSSKDDKGHIGNQRILTSSCEGNIPNDKTNPNLQISHSSDDVAYLDPKKISFRDDSYSQTDEFCNLVTPDLSLVYRPKRKKDQRLIKTVFSEGTSDDGGRVTPSKTKLQQIQGTEKQAEEGDVPLLHPTALHMQFQAELHLFDSYNESIRQVADVENSLYNAKQQDQAAREKMQMQKLIAEQQASGKAQPSVRDKSERQEELKVPQEIGGGDEIDEKRAFGKQNTKAVVEVQTQTANDIATQTDTLMTKQDSRVLDDCRLKHHPGITYRRGSLDLRSIDFESLNELDEISLPSKMRAMSEISLHETTSSIKTETGTEISISTRDVTCSFNKVLDLEMAQLIKDEKETYDKIEMLFKSHERTLHDRTKKLVKLEEQKRALRDTGQDSRISSVKKKQRALLLKLQQEKDEMNRLKELHKKASQERKLMLQKQRNMLNPQMSTKNFLTKLKRSADCQSPRRLSGPMKGYDIRSNSSISSLVDSDKSQIDRTPNLDEKLGVSDSSAGKLTEIPIKCDGDSSLMDANITAGLKVNNKYLQLYEESSNSSRLETPSKYQLKTRKYEEKMPKSDFLRSNTHHLTVDQKLLKSLDPGNSPKSFNVSSDIKSESDTLVEELSKKSKLRERTEGELKKTDKPGMDRENAWKKAQYNPEIKTNKRKTGKSTKPMKTPSANILSENMFKSKVHPNVDEDDLKYSKKSKSRAFLTTDDDNNQSNYQSILEEINLNESQNSLQALVKHSRTVKEKNYKLLRDIAHEHEAKENISQQMIDRDHLDSEKNSNIRIKGGTSNNDVQNNNQGNISTRSQVSTFTISRHSSGDSEKSYSRSVVIRSQQDHQEFKASKKLEQVLHAREAALASRRNCVEDWIAWHAKLKAEESRIIRMEEAALKLLSASSNALSCNDTTMSSDTSDVEGRVELLVEKLAQRRVEMAKLKKEARKQAKHRLKTLEANLLNQIKKYDITINEMRKKLDQKRNFIKESGKLAIEAKSLADVKVPELSTKHIQDIYKTNDLLRSRSESDLIVNKVDSTLSGDNNDKKVCDYDSTSSLTATTKNSSTTNNNEKTTSRSIESVLEEARRTLSSKSWRSSVSKYDNKSISEQKSAKSVDDSEKSASIIDKSTKQGDKSVRSERSVDDIEKSVSITDKDSLSIDKLSKSAAKSTKSAEISEKLPTVGNETSLSDAVIPTETSQTSKIGSKSSEKSASIEDDISDENGGSLFSNKIDLLHLNNKNLTEDINTLENDLKTLSEMVSRFSKKLDEKSVSDSRNQATIDTEKSETIKESMTDDYPVQSIETDDDDKSIKSAATEDRSVKLSKIDEQSVKSSTIVTDDENPIKQSITDNHNTTEKLSEIDTQSVKSPISYAQSVKSPTSNALSVKSNARPSDVSEVSSSKKIDSVSVKSIDNNQQSIKSFDNNQQSIKSTELDDKLSILSSNISSEIKSIISNGSNNRSLTDAEEIDFQAKSKAILNVVAQSIISEHVSRLSGNNFEVSGAALEQSMIDLHKDNEALSLDFNSLEGDIKSISKIISQFTGNKQKTVDNETSDITDQLSQSVSAEKMSIRSRFEQNTDQKLESVKINDKSTDDFDDEVRKSATTAPSVDNDGSLTIEENLEELSSNVEVSEQEFMLPKIDASLGKKQDGESDDDEKSRSKDNIGTNLSTSQISHNWTLSDSFEPIYQYGDDGQNSKFDENDDKVGSDDDDEKNDTTDIQVSLFIPKGESTNIQELHDIDFEVSVGNSEIYDTDDKKTDVNDELDDILDIIKRDSIQQLSKDQFNDDRIRLKLEIGDFVTDHPNNRLNLTAMVEEVEPALQKFTEILVNVENNIAKRTQSKEQLKIADSNSEKISEEIGSKSTNHQISDDISSCSKKVCENQINKADEISQNIEVKKSLDVKIGNNRYITDKNSDSHAQIIDNDNRTSENRQFDSQKIAEKSIGIAEIGQNRQDSTPILSSESEKIDAEYIDENSSDTIKKSTEIESTIDSKKSSISIDNQSKTDSDGNKEVIKDPEYEDISEESLEVSEILDRSKSKSTKSSRIPEKYEVVERTDEVLRILDEISQQSSLPKTIDTEKADTTVSKSESAVLTVPCTAVPTEESQKISLEKEPVVSTVKSPTIQSAASPTSLSPVLSTEQSSVLPDVQIPELPTVESPNDASKLSISEESDKINDMKTGVIIEELNDDQSDQLSVNQESELKNVSEKSGDVKLYADDKIFDKDDISSEVSENADNDTPRGVSEIDLDSPRDQNDESRLDIDILDDDLLEGAGNDGQMSDKSRKKNGKSSGLSTVGISATEKDIEMMIAELKASLDQPGLEVMELEARLLRIEELQIDLEIKKLDIAEKSLYVREIPNKPPPPYTPPGIGGLSPESSPVQLSPSIVPTNIDELMAFTEKATVTIFNAKQLGKDIMSLEAPCEIYDYNNRDSNNEVTKKDRKIYNTFLFDLCKETIAEVYQSEYEKKPGPSWTKPNVKTKPAIKIPKTIDELNEYVNKEVATLFGFKTKLQRENMVMRWSRKRRDRVDELLAREAQAEEDEWTKFHHDELAVKNELTVAVFDTLLLETTNVVKSAYAKKRRIMV